MCDRDSMAMCLGSVLASALLLHLIGCSPAAPDIAATQAPVADAAAPFVAPPSTAVVVGDLTVLRVCDEESPGSLRMYPLSHGLLKLLEGAPARLVTAGFALHGEPDCTVSTAFIFSRSEAVERTLDLADQRVVQARACDGRYLWLIDALATPAGLFLVAFDTVPQVLVSDPSSSDDPEKYTSTGVNILEVDRTTTGEVDVAQLQVLRPALPERWSETVLADVWSTSSGSRLLGVAAGRDAIVSVPATNAMKESPTAVLVAAAGMGPLTGLDAHCDLTGDGVDDIVVASAPRAEEPDRARRTIRVDLLDTVGTDVEIGSDSVAFWSVPHQHAPHDLELECAGDLDGDGIEEMLVLDGDAEFGESLTNQLISRSAQQFGELSATGATLPRVAAADLDADGVADLVVREVALDPEGDPAALRVFFGPFDLARPLERAPDLRIVLDTPPSEALHLAPQGADFDGDGYADIALASSAPSSTRFRTFYCVDVLSGRAIGEAAGRLAGTTE